MENNTKKKFLAVLVRCRNEPFISEWVNYYFNEGVDAIYIVDDNIEDYKFPKEIVENEKVFIIKAVHFKSTKTQNIDVNLLYSKIKDEYEWFIYVDADEFITCKKNPLKTIRQELETTFKDVDCIKVPWVMMSCNRRKEDPKSVLKELIHRWDHDKKHPRNLYKCRCRYDKIEVKSIFKGSKFENICTQHIPFDEKNKALIVDSITKNQSSLDPFYNNLRNKDIENGYLLCYHYRYFSQQSILRKITRFTGFNKAYPGNDPSDMLSSDYPEIIDNTLKNKVIRYEKKSRNIWQIIK